MQSAGGGVIPFRDRRTQGTAVSAEVEGAVGSCQGPRGPHRQVGGAESGGRNVLERLLAFFFFLNL